MLIEIPFFFFFFESIKISSTELGNDLRMISITVKWLSEYWDYLSQYSADWRGELKLIAIYYVLLIIDNGGLLPV